MSVVTQMYYCFKSDVLKKAVNLTTDTMYCALFTTTGTFVATDTSYTTTGTEVANANGYLTGGMTAGLSTITGTSTAIFKITNNAVWTASGAGFTAGSLKLYSATNSNRLICNVDFGSTQTASGGGTFTITWDASNGVFNLS